MKKEELKKAALKFFALNGYEGTSLNQIADEVGIKKSSIYSHYKGKDELFLEVVREAKLAEIQLKKDFFQKNGELDAKEFLYGYLVYIKEMFQQNQSLKFWLRMGFFPPSHLYKIVQEEVTEVEVFQEKWLEKMFLHWIDQKNVKVENEKTATIAYNGILMAMMVELVYYEQANRVDEKLAALWGIFWQGIS
ncbi:TetR/AcrR family transcriptional regulator [Niallia sp. NCCP-28]|uniref:TetR/AcrR family transcriptional regulator n=1 Tax=Niallia sp. NCCP-28 TaxID=2934712 RepID=UPI00208BB8CF|nr:TetR/AcrR family transcriptional regulator [Niallia sp. NCCP-28]GKU82670.1 TetR family transcriptional regulator [Niallia sp. NCCP-28]